MYIPYSNTCNIFLSNVEPMGIFQFTVTPSVPENRLLCSVFLYSIFTKSYIFVHGVNLYNILDRAILYLKVANLVMSLA